MIDLRAARNDPETFRAALARKGAAEVFDELLEADRGVREIQPRVEELRAARKVKGKPTPEQLEELERVKAELQSLEQQLAAAEGRRKELLDRVEKLQESVKYAREEANQLESPDKKVGDAVFGYLLA